MSSIWLCSFTRRGFDPRTAVPADPRPPGRAGRARPEAMGGRSLQDDAVVQRDQIEVAVRSRLDVRHDAEVAAEEQALGSRSAPTSVMLSATRSSSRGSSTPIDRQLPVRLRWRGCPTLEEGAGTAHEQVVAVLRAERAAKRKPIPPGRPRTSSSSGERCSGRGSMKNARGPRRGVSAMFVGDQRICWRPKYPPAANGCGAVGSVSIALNCAIRSGMTP